MPDLALLSFDQLLTEFFDRPGAEVEIHRRYGRLVATMVIDLTGMTERTRVHGIAYALALAAAAERAIQAPILERGGTIVKREADTLFVAFSDPQSALLAALDAQQALARFNVRRTGTLEDRSRNEPILGCIGLGWGEGLLIPGRDLFGAEVNRAFILGEDVARGGDTLCTESFLGGLGEPPSGVGVHRAGRDVDASAGFLVYRFADHR